ncbi:hypothetical protein FGO68_gene17701 [Halteria grandinella]|uniref:Uncharacterized protein n=1 Tax=Halteria grandinella TaxID=5974 RepID=A0A8J8NW29_HALGN|nr:hypothetical protein FGO68_gene17701 [Halteria grandinella]
MKVDCLKFSRFFQITRMLSRKLGMSLFKQGMESLLLLLLKLLVVAQFKIHGINFFQIFTLSIFKFFLQQLQLSQMIFLQQSIG